MAEPDLRRDRPGSGSVATSSVETAAQQGFHVDADTASSSAAWVGGLHESLGNAVLTDALYADTLGAFAVPVTAELGLAVAEIAPEAAGFSSSNAAMLRVLRDATVDWTDPSLQGLDSPGGGQRMSGELLDRFNAAFEYDFSHVVLHTDARAAQASEALSAHAFALGSHIWFGAGEYRPGSTATDRLLAHELTHVVQHDEGRIGAGGGVSSPSDPLEQEAYGNEDRILGQLRQVDSAVARGDLELGTEAESESEQSEATTESNSELAQVVTEAVAAEVDAPEAMVVEAPVADALSTDAGPAAAVADSGVSQAAPAAPTDGAADGALDAPAMRKQARAGEVDDSVDVAGLVSSSRGQGLPAAVAARMGAVLGHDLAHVQVHTDAAAAQAADALNAHAFALGADVFFAEGRFQPGTTEGDALIAHELTHVVQHDEGRLPGGAGDDGVSVSAPTDAAEREAEAVAAQVSSAPADLDVAAPMADFAALTTASADLSADTGLSTGAEVASGASLASEAETGVAMRTRAETPYSTDERAPNRETNSQEKPEKLELDLAGTKITVDLSSTGKELEQTVDLDLEVVPGVKLTQAKILFDNKWNVTNGELSGKLNIGSVLVDSPIKLEVTRRKKVKAEIKDVSIPMGDLFHGKMDLKIESDGVSGKATFSHDQISLGPNFELQSGKLKVSLATDGQFSAEGDLKGKAAGIGTFTLKSRMDNNVLAGQLDVKLEKPVELGAGIKLTNGGVAGEFNHQGGSVLNGSLGLDLNGWATATVTAAWNIPGAGAAQGDQQAGQQDAGSTLAPAGAAGDQAAQGAQGASPGQGGQGGQQAPTGGGQGPAQAAPSVAQSDPAAFGNDVSESSGLRDEAQGQAPSRSQGEQGAGNGTAQGGDSGPIVLTPPGGGKWSLQGVATLSKPMQLDQGVTAESGELTVNVTDNVLQPVQAKTKLKLPDGWSADIAGTFDVQGKTFTGDADVELAQATAIGTTGLTVSSVKGKGRIEKNELVNVKADVAGKFEREGFPKFDVKITGADYDVKTRELSGVGTVTLSADHKLGTQGNYNLFLTPGTEAQATLEKNELKEVKGLFKLALREGEQPFVSAEINTTWPVAGGKLSGTGKATLDADKQLATMGGESLWMVKGGQINATLEEEVLTKVSGAIKLSVRDESEWATVEVSGDVNLQGEEGFTGSGTAKVVREKKLLGGAEGKYELVVTEETSITANIAQNKLTDLTGKAALALKEAGERFVKVSAEGKYLPETGMFTGNGTASLEKDKELLQVGTEHVWLSKGGELKAAVADNVVTDLSGKVLLAVKDPEQWAAIEVTGKLDPKGEEGFTGEGSLSVTRDKELPGGEGPYKLFVATSTKATAKVEKNKLNEVGGKLNLTLKEGDEAFVNAEAQGKYVPETGMANGTGKATLAKDKKLAAVGTDEIWLGKGGELTAAVADNVVTDLSGKVLLTVKDPEQWASAEVQGKVDPKGTDGFTGTGKVTVSRDKRVFGEDGGKYSLWLSAGEGAGATAHFEKDVLKKIDGNVPFAVKDDQPEALIKGAVAGTYTPEGKDFTGSGSMALGRNVDVGQGKAVLRLLTGTGGSGTVEKSQVKEVTGQVKGQLLVDGAPEVEFNGSGTYNVAENKVTQAEVQAKLLRTLEPFGAGVVQISELAGAAKIENNEVKEITGNATVKLPTLNNSTGKFSISWKKEGDKDRISGAGKLHLVIFKGSKPGRGAEGDVDVTFDGTDKFKVKGDVQYNITRKIGGKIGVEADEKLDPVLSGNLDLKSELIPAGELFQKKFDILPEQSLNFAAGPVPMTFKFGATAGFGLGMQALALSSKIGVSNWRPLSQHSEVPDFQADAKLNWGVNANASAAAWMSLGLGVSAASAGAGIKGDAKLEAPLTTAVDVKLHGGNEGFWGDMGVSLGVSANLSFQAIPFLYANLFSKRWEHDFEGWTFDLGEIAKFNWGARYEFGDKKSVSSQNAAPANMPAATQSQTKHESKPAVRETAPRAPRSGEDGPDLSGVQELIGNVGGGGRGRQATEMEQRLGLIKDAAKGIAAISYLMSTFGDLLTWAAVAGPIGLVIRLVYKLITGEITWDKLSTAVKDAITGIQAIYALIQPYLPTWWQKLTEIITRGVNLFDEWWNGDSRMYEAVQRGEHNYANSEMLGEMVYRMLDFWSQEEHKRASLTVLETAAGKGQFNAAVAKVGLDTCKSKFDESMWTSDDITQRWKRLAVRTGIGRYVQKVDFWGSRYTEFEYSR